MNWLLIVVLVLLVAGTIAGFAKGFAKTLYSLVATALIIVLTIVLCPFTVKALKGADKLTNAVYEKVDAVINLDEAYEKAITKEKKDASSEEQTKELPENVDDVLEKFGLPSVMRKAMTGSDDFKEYVKSSADDFARGKLGSLEKYVCEKLTNIIISALGFIITFAVVALFVFFLGKILGLISKIPGLKTIDKFLGGCAGFLEALLVVWIAFMIITLIASTSFGQTLLQQINSSSVLSFIYEHNLISRKIFTLI